MIGNALIMNGPDIFYDNVEAPTSLCENIDLKGLLYRLAPEELDLAKDRLSEGERYLIFRKPSLTRRTTFAVTCANTENALKMVRADRTLIVQKLVLLECSIDDSVETPVESRSSV